MIPAAYRWVSLCPPFSPDRLSWWSKASILKDSTWVFKLVWKNPIQSDNTARWRWSGNSVLTPRWRWCADRSPLMFYPFSRTDMRRSLSALLSWGISVLDMSGYFYISLAFHLFTLLWKYGDLVVLVIRIFSELCVMEDILETLVALSSLWQSNILPPWDKCIVFYWYEPPPLGYCLGRQHVRVSTHASYRAHLHSLHPHIWLQS